MATKQSNIKQNQQKNTDVPVTTVVDPQSFQRMYDPDEILEVCASDLNVYAEQVRDWVWARTDKTAEFDDAGATPEVEEALQRIGFRESQRYPNRWYHKGYTGEAKYMAGNTSRIWD